MQGIKCPNCTEIRDKLNKAEEELGRQYEVIGENELLLDTLKKQLQARDEQIKQLEKKSISQSNTDSPSHRPTGLRLNEIEFLEQNNKKYLDCLSKLLTKESQAIKNMQYSDLLQVVEEISAKFANRQPSAFLHGPSIGGNLKAGPEFEHNQMLVLKVELKSKIAEYEKLLSEHRQLVEINQQVVREKADMLKENSALEQKLFNLNQNFEKSNTELIENKKDLTAERRRVDQLQSENKHLVSRVYNSGTSKEAETGEELRVLTSEISSPDYDERDAVIVRLNERVLQLEEKLFRLKWTKSNKELGDYREVQDDPMEHQSARVFGSLLRSQLDPKELPVVQNYFKRIETENENLRLQIRKFEQERKLITETLAEIVESSKVYRSELFAGVFKKLSVMMGDVDKLHKNNSQAIDREDVRTFILLLLNTVKFIENNIKSIWVREDQSTSQITSLIKIAQENQIQLQEYKQQNEAPGNDGLAAEKLRYEGPSSENAHKQQRKKLEISLPEYDHVEPVKFHLASPQEDSSQTKRAGTPLYSSQVQNEQLQAHRRSPIPSGKASDKQKQPAFPAEGKNSLHSTPNSKGLKSHQRQQSGQLNNKSSDLPVYFSTPKSYQSQQEISTQTSRVTNPHGQNSASNRTHKSNLAQPRGGASNDTTSVKKFELGRTSSAQNINTYHLEATNKDHAYEGIYYSQENTQQKPNQLSERPQTQTKQIHKIDCGTNGEELDYFDSNPTHILSSLKELKAFVKNINENNDSILNHLSKTYERSTHRPEIRSNPPTQVYKKASTPTHELTQSKKNFEINNQFPRQNNEYALYRNRADSPKRKF